MEWVIVAIIVIAVAAVAAYLYSRRRTAQLQERFGPEYRRTVEEAGSQRQAESELRDRERRVEKLDIRPLPAAAVDRYSGEWRDVQSRFVDDPSGAVGEADRLVLVVMEERGYPMDDFDRRASDISVDYPHVVEDYRAAHGISTANERGDATTEDLRQAMVHYRSLFDHLLGSNDAEREREATR
jgi:hypothetical protein